MAQTSVVLSLPYIQASQAQKHVTHNEAIQLLDLIVQPVVLDATRTEPPASPAIGDRHILALGATGAWAGHDGAIAAWTGSSWLFAEPQQGWQARDLDSGATLIFDGSGWAADIGGTSNPATLGINASADTTNRLTVAADAVLLNHDGAGHQLKINKSAAGDTASLLFQTAFSGRAEMGIAGNDDFAIKVSADGASFTTALAFDGATGIGSGAAIQQSAEDATPGRLMRADWGYGPATLLGPVGQAAGVPTGAVIERGSSANGDYVRFADGTQICTQTLTLTYEAAERVGATWSFGQPFSAAPTVSVTVDAGSLSGAAPGAADLGTCLFGSLGVASVNLSQYRITGATDFAGGDSLTCTVIAMGRWA